jgi:hypothetical protein
VTLRPFDPRDARTGGSGSMGRLATGALLDLAGITSGSAVLGAGSGVGATEHPK